MKEKLSKTAATGVLGRVVRYMLHYYKGLFALVLVCIVVCAVSTVIGSAFPQTLVDDYIVPMINSGSQDFSGLFHAIVRLVGILAVGVVAIFAYNRIMVNISQGTMRHLGTTSSTRWSRFPLSILIPTPMATLCRCTPTTWIPFVR